MTTSTVAISNKTNFHADIPAAHALLFAEMVLNSAQKFAKRTDRRFVWREEHSLILMAVRGFVQLYAVRQVEEKKNPDVTLSAYITLAPSGIFPQRLCIYIELVSDPYGTKKEFKTKVEL